MPVSAGPDSGRRNPKWPWWQSTPAKFTAPGAGALRPQRNSNRTTNLWWQPWNACVEEPTTFPALLISQSLEIAQKNKRKLPTLYCDQWYKEFQQKSQEAVSMDQIPRPAPNNANFNNRSNRPDLLLQLDEAGIYISTGAACQVRTSKPSMYSKLCSHEPIQQHPPALAEKQLKKTSTRPGNSTKTGKIRKEDKIAHARNHHRPNSNEFSSGRPAKSRKAIKGIKTAPPKAPNHCDLRIIPFIFLPGKDDKNFALAETIPDQPLKFWENAQEKLVLVLHSTKTPKTNFSTAPL